MSIKNFNFLKPLSIANKIRLGKEGDGGYVVYKPSLDSVDALLTYGVGWDVDFEVEFFNHTNKKVHMHDHTMFPDERGEGKPLYGSDNEFLRKHIDHLDEWEKYLGYLEENDVIFHNEGIGTKREGKLDTLTNHIARYGLQCSRVLLKMDIEGAEYPILDSDGFYEHIDVIDQIVLEMHDLKNRLRDVVRIMERLGAHYEIVHIHGNNGTEGFTLYGEDGDIPFPDVIELTLVKRESLAPEDILTVETEYPVEGLDYPNDHRMPHPGLQFDLS